MRNAQIDEVECIVPDLAGVGKGKLVTATKFLEQPTRIPKSIFLQCIHGAYPERFYEEFNPTDEDIVLAPDMGTLRSVPWLRDPTAQVIHDAQEKDGSPLEIAPRQVLKRVIAAYEERGWSPIVAPEIEFYLVRPNPDPDYPLESPLGVSGRAEVGRQSYGIDSMNEYSPVLDDFYDYCESLRIEIDALTHEAGSAQMEVNMNHGNPLDLADQVFYVKRALRAAALKHKMRATFMARPIEGEPGSAMHIHHSIVDAGNGENIFSQANGDPSSRFYHFIGGLQRLIPCAMPFFAPYVNSYRRIMPYMSAPVNTQWGFDNRTTGLRVPDSEPTDRRVENRVVGADTNPYLALAASLACGLIGMVEQLKPSDPFAANAYDLPIALPRSLNEGLANLQGAKSLARQLGEELITVFTHVKRAEFNAYMHVVSPWEREYLLDYV
jgi:glutamine synthetase